MSVPTQIELELQDIINQLEEDERRLRALIAELEAENGSLKSTVAALEIELENCQDCLSESGEWDLYVE